MLLSPRSPPFSACATHEISPLSAQRNSRQVSDNLWERMSIACIRAKTACSPGSVSCRVLWFRDVDKSSQKAFDNVTNNGRAVFDDEKRGLRGLLKRLFPRPFYSLRGIPRERIPV